MTKIDPLTQVKALQELAAALPAGSEMSMSLVWENDHGAAGITLWQSQVTVYFRDAEQSVDTLSEAADILRRILTDEVAAVRAYAKEQFVYCGLAPTSDPSAGFNGLISGGSRSKTMPDIDYVDVATWSRGYLEDAE